jgi:hypothetical protein
MRQQILPTKFHAFEDYTTAATIPFIPRLFGWSPRVRRLFDIAALTAGAQSLLTDYEGGAARVLPMQAHLAADVLMGAGLVTAACLMANEPRAARLTLAGLGAYSIALALTTKPVPKDEPADGPSRRAQRSIRSLVG